MNQPSFKPWVYTEAANLQANRGEPMSMKISNIPFLTCVAAILCVGWSVDRSRAASVEVDVKPVLPRIPDRTFNVKIFGAVGDGKAWDTEAFSKALAEIEKQGGGKLV